MKDNEEMFGILYEKTTPVQFKGIGVTGYFLFSQLKPWPSIAFESLEDAVEEFGSLIKIKGDALTSERFHAGYNDSIVGKKYEPRTTIKDGDPRVLTNTELLEYIYGYMHGLIIKRK